MQWGWMLSLRRPEAGRRTLRPAGWTGIALVMTVVVAIGLIDLNTNESSWLTPQPAAANHARIKMPFPAGQQWRVLQGYNTSPTQGGSHWNCDTITLKDQPSQSQSCRAGWQYRFSLDLVRADGATAGQQVLSPVDGTIRWIDESTGGMSINLGDGYAVAFFHARLAPGLTDGQPVRQGQILGTVAPAGEANAGSTPHIHLTMWRTNDGGNWDRQAIPFAGTSTVDGYAFPDQGASARNQHRSASVTSTNTAIGSGANGIPVAPTLTSPPTGTTAKTPSVTFAWNAVSGASEYQVVLDGATYGPWVSETTWTSPALTAGQHSWAVRARNAAGTGPLSSTRIVTTPAGASTTPTLSPSESQGPVGTTVSVSGSGFANGESVAIRWDTTTGTPLVTIRANASGAFTTQVTVPDTPAGQHMLRANATATATFTVRPSLSRTPTRGAPWTPIDVTARGFGPNENVQLNWNTATGPTLGTIRTNASGTGTLRMTVPNDSPGWHDYTGYGQSSRLRVYGAIEVLSSVTLTPTTVASGGNVRAVARGFPPGQTAIVSFNATGTSGGATLCRAPVASNGTLVCERAIPSTTAGVFPIRVSAGSIAVSADLTVTGPAGVTISPASGQSGTIITATIGGFGPNEAVDVFWDGEKWQTVRTDARGNATVRATVPTSTPGRHTLSVRGQSSGKTASRTFDVASGVATAESSRLDQGVYSVFATREGLVGGTTSSGHKIVEDDLFVSLPACTTTNCPGGPYWGSMTNCGSSCYVKVINPNTNACRVEPILDTGPWFRVDDWWNTTASRYINRLASNPNDLPQGYTAADAARNGLDVGYGISSGIGNDDQRRAVGNRAAIDIADGTYRRLGLAGGLGQQVRVEMIWQTGANPSAAAQGCGHPLNEKPVQTEDFPQGTPRPTFSGALLTPTGSAGSANGATSRYAIDGRASTWWRTYTGDSQSGQFVIDYGSVRQLTGVRWYFEQTGYADQFVVETSVDRANWQTVGTFGNAPRNSWRGVTLGRLGRYVRVTFYNPNNDPRLGYVTEFQTWGREVQTTSPGTANPTFSGQRLTERSSSSSSGSSPASAVYDRNTGTWWRTYTGSSTSGSFVIDYGQSRQLTGVRWRFGQNGYADQFIVQTSTNGSSWSTVNTYGNASGSEWRGVGLNRQGRYVRFLFNNPNGDALLGYVSEVELWGGAAEQTAIPGSNPQFAGQPLPIVASGTTPSNTTRSSSFVRDGSYSTSWYSTTSPPADPLTLLLDLGSAQQLTGIRWTYWQTGGADRQILQVSSDGETWTQLIVTSNRDRLTWEGVATNRTVRYVRFVFQNPNQRPVVGYVSEVQIWGQPQSMSLRSASVPDEIPVASPEATLEASPVADIATPQPTDESPVAGTPTAAPEEPTVAATPAVDAGPPPPASPQATTPDDQSGEPTNVAATPDVVTDEQPDPSTDSAATPEATLEAVADDEPAPPIEPTTEPTEAPSVEIPGIVANTDGDGANCRDAPSTSGGLIDFLSEGTDVTLIGEPVDGWQPVRCLGTDGWVLADYVSTDIDAAPPIDRETPTATPGDEASPSTPDSTTPEPTATAEPTVEMVERPGWVDNPDGDGVNCRAAPSSEADVIGLVDDGTEIVLRGDPVDEWQAVVCLDREGWIFAEYVSTEPPARDDEPEAPIDGPDGDEDPPAEEPTDQPAPEVEPTLEPEPTAIPTPEPVLVTRELIVPVASDTSVAAAEPDATADGNAGILMAGGEDGQQIVLTFEVDGVDAGSVVDATLVVAGAGDTAGSGGSLIAMLGVWLDEGSTSWNDVAGAGGWSAGWVDGIAPGNVTTIDVSGVVTADGTVSFVIDGTPERVVAIASDESGSGAYLVLTIEEWTIPEE